MDNELLLKGARNLKEKGYSPEQVDGWLKTKNSSIEAMKQYVGVGKQKQNLPPMTDEQKTSAAQMAEQIRPQRTTGEQLNNIFVKDTLDSSGARAALMTMQGISNATMNPAGYVARAAGIDTRPVKPKNFVDRGIEKGAGYAFDGAGLALAGRRLALTGALGKGKGITSRIAKAVLSPKIATSAVSSAGGGALEGAVNPRGLTGQIVTNMIGGGTANLLRPSSWSSALPAAQQSIADIFKRLGSQATAADVRGGEGVISGIDNALQKTFLGGGLRETKAQQIREIGNFFENTVTKLSHDSRITPVTSGRRAAEETSKNLKNRAGKIYSNINSKIPADKQINLSEVQKLANENHLSAFKNEAPEAFSMMIGDDVADMLNALPSSISKEAYKPLKSSVGAKISSSLIPDTNKAQWETVYGKLAEAQKTLYEGKGVRDFERANRAYSGIVDFTKDYLEPMINKRQGSQIVNEALERGKSASVINTLRRNANPKDVDNLMASWLQDAGSVVNPETAALEFSPIKLSAQLAKLNPKVRSAMFRDTEIGKDIDDLAKVSGIIARGLKNSKDQSNLFNTTAIGILGAGAISEPITTASTVGATKGLSYLLQNPKILQSLTKATKSVPTGIANALRNMSVEKGINQNNN